MADIIVETIQTVDQVIKGVTDHTKFKDGWDRNIYNEELITQITNLFNSSKNIETLVNSLNNLYSNYYTLSNNAKYTIGGQAKQFGKSSNEGLVQNYQKDYDKLGFHTASFRATASDSPQTNDYWKDDKWQGGDNLWGSVTNERRANYFTRAQATELNEKLKERGYEYVIDPTAPQGEGGYEYYKIQKIGGGTPSKGTTPPGDKTPPSTEKTTTSGYPTIDDLPTDTQPVNGIDLTPLESLSGLLDSYSKNAAIKRINMSEQYPLKQGYRYYTAVKDGFNTQQTVSAQAEEERKRASQNALQYGDADAYINSMLQVNNQAQVNKNNAAAQSENIYNQSLAQQEQNFNAYNALQSQIANENANIIAKNRSLRNNARKNEIIYNDASDQKHREYIKHNAALVKKAETDQRNNMMQLREYENYSKQLSSITDEYQQAIDVASKEPDAIKARELIQAAQKAYSDKKQALDLQYKKNVASKQEIYGHEYYYPTYSKQRNTTPTVTGSVSSVATSKRGGKLSPRLQEGGTLGGIVYSPGHPAIAESQPSLSTPQASRSQGYDYESKKKEEDKGFITEDILLKIQGKMLPADFAIFKAQVDKYNQDMKWLGYSTIQFSSIMETVNNGILQKDRFEKSCEHSIDQFTLDELALDSGGDFIALNSDGKLTIIDKKKAHQDITFGKKLNYKLLTNREVAELRFNDPSYAFNTHLTNQLATTIGFSQVQEDVMNIVEKMGKVTTKGDLTDYIVNYFGDQIRKTQAKEPTKEQEESIKAFSKQYFGYHEDGHTSVNGDNALTKQQMNYTLQYLWSVLPKKHKDVLIAQSIQNGTYTGKDYETLIQILQNAINFRMDREESQTSERTGTSGSGSGGGSGESLQHTTDLSRNTVFFDGNLFQTKGNFVFNPNDRIALGAIASEGNLDYMYDIDNNNKANTPIDAGPLGKTVLDDRALGTILDKDNIYIGNKKVSKYEVEDYVNLDQMFYTVYLPEDNKGDIDFNVGSNISKIYQDIMNNPQMQMAQDKDKYIIFNEILRQNYPNMAQDLLMKSNGQLVYQGNQLGKYLVTYGYRDKDFFEDDNPFAVEITGSDETLYEKRMSEAYDRWGIDDPGYGFFDLWKDLYKTPIFIKIRDDANVELARKDKRIVERKQTVGQVMTRQAAQAQPSIRIGEQSSSVL